MLKYEQAVKEIVARAQVLPKLERRLEDLLGHVLAQPLQAPFPMPQFDNSAVDGFGVLAEDTRLAKAGHPVVLELAGEIQAGAKAALSLRPGQAFKILTGAPVPESVQAVVMREYCRERNAHVEIEYAAAPGENIRRQGEEFPAGIVVLPGGVLVTPPVVGLLASLGYRSALVYRKPRVALIATGDELVEPGQPLAPGQIYNSNSFALKAALQAFGAEVTAVLHARDCAESTGSAFAEALSEADLVISTGGVSVGDYDYVKDVLEGLGVQTIFWRIAVKPGKPVYFGTLAREGGSSCLVFGLPGNPVSGLVTYHQFVVPALRKLSGYDSMAPSHTLATLSSALRKKPGRLDFVRGRTVLQPDGTLAVNPTVGQDSHMLSGLAKADCLIHFQSEAERIEAGSRVLIDMLQWWP